MEDVMKYLTVPTAILAPGALAFVWSALIFGVRYESWLTALLAMATAISLMWYLRFRRMPTGGIIAMLLVGYLTLRWMYQVWEQLPSATDNVGFAMAILILIFLLMPIAFGIASANIAYAHQLRLDSGSR